MLRFLALGEVRTSALPTAKTYGKVRNHGFELIFEILGTRNLPSSVVARFHGYKVSART